MSRTWEERFDVFGRHFIPWLDRYLPTKRPVVFEWGCGNGASTLGLASSAAHVFAVDIDEGAIAEARFRSQALGIDNCEFEAANPEELPQIARQRISEADAVMFFAALEHMTLSERLQALATVRDELPPGGVVIVCETPNRLLWHDYHTSEIPFFAQLPEPLALLVAGRSSRPDFREALQFSHRDPDGGTERLARWGRGLSHHEFELVFGDLTPRVIASNWEPELLPERFVHREELALSRFFDRVYPGFPPVFSRYYLDFILSPVALPTVPAPMRPWPLSTEGGSNIAFTAGETLHIPLGSELSLPFEKPVDEVVVTLDVPPATSESERPSLRVRSAGHELQPLEPVGCDGWSHFFRVRLRPPARELTLVSDRDCVVSFVGSRAAA